MYCMHCGKPLPIEASFCPNCGKSCADHVEHHSDIPEGEQKTPAQRPPEQLYGRYAGDTPQDSPQQPGQSAMQKPEIIPTPPASPAQSFSGSIKVSQISAVTKRKMPKWLLITLCAVSVLMVASLILVLLNPEDTKSADTIQQSSAIHPTRTPDIPSATPRQTDVQPKEGECLYIGYGTYFDIDSLKLSFILSDDKSYIYDVKIELTNLNANMTGGNTNTNIKISSATESFPGQYPVDYENGTDEIDLGASKISTLCFDGAVAWFELDYTYIYSGTGMDVPQTEIPFGTTYVEMATEDDTESIPSAESDPKPENIDTVFDESKLQNWNDEAFRKTVGVSSVRDFTPSSPVPLYYIVSTDGVYDPVTEKESEGGYNSGYSRHLPISTSDMLRTSGNLMNGGLTLTDDPNKATYVLILNYSYMYNIGSFHFSEDDSTIPQYHATLDAELFNLVTQDSIYSQTKGDYATYSGESVNTAMLDNAKGKQLYGGTISLYADDFDGYWRFVNN